MGKDHTHHACPSGNSVDDSRNAAGGAQQKIKLCGETVGRLDAGWDQSDKHVLNGWLLQASFRRVCRSLLSLGAPNTRSARHCWFAVSKTWKESKKCLYRMCPVPASNLV